MAKAVGISRTSVQRIWAEAGLKPHLVKRFKISNDPAFEEKVTDVVGLYMNPPDRALVLCVDEKSQIQALDRTQPGLPLKKGRAATMTHDYKRHGTTTLYAALDVRTGLVIGDCKPRHRAQEFIAFLKLIDEIVDDREGLARQASTLPSALHADQRLLAQSGRALLRGDHEEAHPARCVCQRGRARSCHPRLSGEPQRQSKAVRVEQDGAHHPGKGTACLQRTRTHQSWVSTVRVGTL